MAILPKMKFGITVLVLEIIFMVLFAVLVKYDESATPLFKRNGTEENDKTSGHGLTDVQTYYPMFQDVHVMIFIGFGFLMTFLKRYGFSSIGLNFLIAAFVIQWSVLMSGFFHMTDGKIHFGITNMLTADFAAAAVLITFGAVLGKTSPLQMIVIAFIEIIFFSLNEWIGVSIFMASDIGGSMFVHTFGAYYGLALARVLWTEDVKDNPNEGTVYHSDLFSMIGTVFLWIYWPSFNSALAEGDNQHRAVINTYLSLASCCVITFAVSSIISKKGKFNMVHIQNATLAGGVAVGTSADMMVHPAGALLIGSLAGVLSVVGYDLLTPLLASKLKIHDTCGVNNLHGMPGLMAGIIGAIMATLASYDNLGESLSVVFAARVPDTANGTSHGIAIMPYGRSATEQAGFQISALCVTLVIAVVGGIVTGFLVKLPLFDQPNGKNKPIMDDSLWFETPDDLTEVAMLANNIKLDEGGIFIPKDKQFNENDMV